MIHLYFFMVGTVVYSFLGVVIDRFPDKSIVFPTSHCNTCQKQLACRDLIPILSQIYNHSACRFCGQGIPLWYASFEFFGGLTFLLTSLTILDLSSLIVITMGLTLAIYDVRSKEYPLLVWLVFQLPLFFTGTFSWWGLCFLVLAILASCLPIGIGAGDFLYLLSCSAIFNLTELCLLIQIASLVGIGIFYLQKEKGKIAFIPCLFFGAVCLILYKLLLLG